MRLSIILVLIMVSVVGTSLGNGIATGKPKKKLSWIKAGQKEQTKIKHIIQRQRGECVTYW